MLEVGDVVKIKSSLEVGEDYGGVKLIEGMRNIVGKTGKITTMYGKTRFLVDFEEDRDWYVSRKMIECEVEEQVEPKRQVGKEFAQITKEMLETHIKKNADYGNSFAEQFEEYGMMSSCIRLEDKLRRTKQLTKSEALVVDEKLEDTLLDMANYAIMTVIELRKRK